MKYPCASGFDAYVRAGKLAGSLSSNPCELGHVIEIRIPIKEDGFMLNYKRRDPKIIRWNGCALLSQVTVKVGIKMRRLFVREENPHAVGI